MKCLALYNKERYMHSSLSVMPPYEPSILPYDDRPQKSHIVNDVISEPSIEQCINFLKEVIHVLTTENSASTRSHIDNILNKYGFNENISHVKDDNMLSIINKLQKIQFQVSGSKSALSEQKEIVNDIAEKINKIRNEIRNQTLYRRTSSAQFTAAATTLARELSTDSELTTGTSYAEMWLRLAIFIGEIKEDYVDFYADLMQKYTEMYESFNENVQKASSEAVSTGDDGNNVSFDTQKMQAGYDAFQKDVDRLNSELGSVDGWDTMTDDEKRRMMITLEPAYKVDSTGTISFNMDQYHSVSGTYPTGIKDGKVSTASYQAWLATFNAAGNAFQSNMQSFAQRYSQANNNFDTLNKILSSAISTLADSARDVLKSLS